MSGRRPDSQRACGALCLGSFLMAIALGACQSAPSPAPAAQPPPSTMPIAATPSVAARRNPEEIGLAFMNLIRKEGEPLRVEYSGEIIVGDLDFRLIRAALVDAGEDERADVHIAVGDEERRSSIVRTGGQSLLKEGDLPWIRLENEALRYDAFDIFDGVEDVSVRLHGSGSEGFYRLVPVNEVTLSPEVLNLNLRGFDSLRILASTFEIVATEDGKPVTVELGLHIEGTRDGAEVVGSGAYRYQFERVGEPVAIDVPDGSIWTRFRSERFAYSIAHPEDWVVEEDPSGVDRFLAPSGDYLLVSRFPVPGDMTVEDASAGVMENYQPLFGGIAPVATLDATIDGGEAKIVNFLGDFAFPDGVAPLHLLAAVLIRDGMGYELTLIAEPGMEDSDRELFDDVIATFDCSCR